MYRTVSTTIFLFCLTGPLWACSCGGTLSYAPIVASPPLVLEKTKATEVVETEIIETVDPAPSEKTERTAEKPVIPAIPKSVYPDSIARKPQLTLKRLQIFDLPVAMMEQTKEKESTTWSENSTQAANKPPAPPFKEEEKQADAETGQEETSSPPASIIDDDKNNNEGEEESTGTLVGQVPSRRAEEEVKAKPGPPEGVGDAVLPDKLLNDPSLENNITKEPVESMGGSSDTPEQETASVTPPPDTSENAGSGQGPILPVSQWTTTILVILTACSLGAFLCMVFVVGEYRRRWLNAIMSQNGMMPGFQGGLYDMPGVSIGYGRYDD